MKHPSLSTFALSCVASASLVANAQAQIAVQGLVRQPPAGQYAYPYPQPALPASVPQTAYQPTPPPAAAVKPAQGMSNLQSEQMQIFRAVDTGNIGYLKSHFDFVRSFAGVNPILFNQAADLNFRDRDGNTPLIRAAMQPNQQVVQMLVENGADLNAVNVRNESALVTSYVYHHFNITQYLLKQDAADPYNVSDLLDEAIDKERAMAPGQEGGVSSGSLMLAGGGLAAAGAVVALAAGGGGGGGGGGNGVSNADAALNPQNLPPSSFLTSEALNQEGIAGMNAHYSLARGYDGSIYSRDTDGTLLSTTPIGAVKVAVADSGVDLTHPDLAANILAGSSFTCNDAGCVAGGDVPAGGAGAWHGTAVAGIIGALKNGVGIHGVAPAAKIMSIRFADNSSNLTNGDAPGIKLALDNGAQVLNGSYGFPSVTPPSATVVDVQAIVNNIYGGTTFGTQIQRGVGLHAVFVFSAGNEGLANPDLPAGLPYYFQGATAPAGISQVNYDTINPSHYNWTGNVIAAVSVDSSNVISSFSNRCGVAATWCLAAPGEISMSTAPAGGYTGGIQGTSFSAPNITGAVAVMLGAFPQLTPEKVVQILFDTATDLGAAGVDSVYGHGLVNLEKATSPTDGGWSLTSLRQVFSFAGSGMGLSAPFGNALAASRAQLQFLDAYGKNYFVPLTAVNHPLSRSMLGYERMDKLAQTRPMTLVPLGDGSTLQLATTPAQDSSGESIDKLTRFSYALALPVGGEDKEAHMAFHYHMNLADALLPEPQRGITGAALKNPYLTLTDGMNSSVVDFRNGKAHYTMAAYMGNYGQDDYAYQFHNSKSMSGLYSELAYKPVDKLKLTVDSGMMLEKNSMLGSEASGAFSIDHSATYYTGISGKYALSDGMALIANYHMGMTQVAADANSMINDFGNIRSHAFAAGAEFTHVQDERDVLGLVVSQPLRVTGGSAGLTLPVSMAANGDIGFARSWLNLAPTGRETDFETYYTLHNGEDSDVGVDAMLRLQPDNNAASGPDTAVLATYRFRVPPDWLRKMDW